MKCPKCNKDIPEKDIRRKPEELFCQHCQEWRFYGSLRKRGPHGGTMKPDNVTEQLKREYDGKTDYHL